MSDRGTTPASTDDDALYTRAGKPANADPAVAFSLSRMHSYLSLGVPSELVRERILSPQLADAIGRDGRALLANVLDYAHEIMDSSGRPRRRTRKRFFRTLERLNQQLQARGLGYFVYATFDWDDDFQRVEQVTFDALAINAVRRYQTAEREIRVLHVERKGPARSHVGALGFTAPDYQEAFVLPGEIHLELRHGLVPALADSGATHLFGVADEERGRPWYREFRQRLAEVLLEDLRSDGAETLHTARTALFRAVELHELQHQLDYRDKLSVQGIFRELADRLEDLRLASASMHEVSAHLAQLARDPTTARVMLAEITSYAFTDHCKDVNCLASLLILDELASECGLAEPGDLMRRPDYHVRAVAERYLAIVQFPADHVAFAARQAWQRLFERPLPTAQPLP